MTEMQVEARPQLEGAERPDHATRTPLLRVESLDVSYGEIRALKAASFEVGRGEIVALLGSNGAGKSTIINAICGLAASQSGKIVLDGQNLSGRSPRERFRLGVGLSPEGRRVFPTMSVAENLMVGGQTLRSRRESEEDLELAYRIFPKLKERDRQIAGTLSGGEQQMLAIGRALMGRPKLLLLDEPSLGMAPIIIEQVLSVCRLLRQRGISVLLAEQNAGAALALADRAYMLTLGTVSKGKDAREFNSADLSAAYFGGS